MTQREQEILQLISKDPMISQQEIADTLGITRSSVAVHISNLIRKGYIAGKGYVLRSENYAVVVGGVNVDIGGRSHAPLVAADSNPGTVTVSLGGVGRNIAHNMRLLGMDVRFLTAFGNDMNGQRIASSCMELGIDIRNALRLDDAATSTYLYLTDEQGEMALAVSDMSICEKITPEYLAENSSVLDNARVVVADANIPAESLRWLAENCSAPLFVDPVSTTKAEKLRNILGSIHTLKPNKLEAELLSGIPIRNKADLEAAAAKLLSTGMQRVFISLGGDGALAADKTGCRWLKNIPGNMVNTTGCGDAFMASLVWSFMEGFDLTESARAGLAAGSIAMESAQTINPNMSAEALKQRMAR